MISQLQKKALEDVIAKHTSEGHPDKICDQAYDALLGVCLTCDPEFKVECETCVKDNTVMVAREITVTEKTDHETVVQSVLQKIGINPSLTI